MPQAPTSGVRAHRHASQLAVSPASLLTRTGPQRILQASEGIVTGELIVHEDHLAATGYLHAGTVVALADTTCGYGCLARLPEGKAGFTTIELKANFLGTAQVGHRLVARAVAVHLGGTTQVWDATVVRNGEPGPSERPIAVFRATQMLLDPR